MFPQCHADSPAPEALGTDGALPIAIFTASSKIVSQAFYVLRIPYVRYTSADTVRYESPLDFP